MKQLYIIVIIILIAFAIYKYYETNKDDEIKVIPSSIKEETISQHFIKMFRDVSPWPGISQASQKSKQQNDDGKIENNLVDNGYHGVFADVNDN